MNNLNHNVLFITIDSCRYDTAINAATPNLDSIAPLRKAETTGTYTFPSHHSFFIGILPRPLDGGEYFFDDYQQIWRSSSARDSSKKVFTDFDESNIIKHYISSGAKVSGFGGVSFFNTTKKGNTLPKLFPDFKFYPRTLSGDAKIPRGDDVFPLNHLDEIIEATQDSESFFIFVNEPSTHIPYDHPGSEITQEYTESIRKLYEEHYSPHTLFYEDGSMPLSEDEISLLKTKQVESLEWIDNQIGELIKRIPNDKPTLIIVTGDHGEEFGESGRFGHAHYSDSVMYVPLWVGLINRGKSHE